MHGDENVHQVLFMSYSEICGLHTGAAFWISRTNTRPLLDAPVRSQTRCSTRTCHNGCSRPVRYDIGIYIHRSIHSPQPEIHGAMQHIMKLGDGRPLTRCIRHLFAKTKPPAPLSRFATAPLPPRTLLRFPRHPAEHQHAPSSPAATGARVVLEIENTRAAKGDREMPLAHTTSEDA